MDGPGILGLLRDMVRAPSHPGIERQEEAGAGLGDGKDGDRDP